MTAFPARWPVWVAFLRNTPGGLEIRGPCCARERGELLDYCGIAADAQFTTAVVFRAEVDLASLATYAADGRKFRRHPAFLVGYTLKPPKPSLAS